jgi:putative transposase
MARRLRTQREGATYHLFIRGVRRATIFHDDHDRETFLSLVDSTTSALGWLVTSYCLMRNHYHLSLTTPNANVAVGMKALNACYAQGFNHRHGYTGHVFESRYNDVVVKSDDHLQGLAAYIVLNPVRAGLCSLPGEWRWSSYRATIGDEPARPFLTLEALLETFDPDPAKARELYRGFVFGRLEEDAAKREGEDVTSESQE